MGRKRAVVPKLREVNGQASCWVNGKREYFGKWGSPEAEEAFRTFLAQHFTNPAAKPHRGGVFLAHLIADFLKSPDAPAAVAKQLEVTRLIKHLGSLATKQAVQVTAQELKAWVKAKAEETRPVKGGAGEVEPKYCKTTLRAWFARLKQIYLWAIEAQKLSAQVAGPILAIRKLPLQAARDEADVEPVPRHHVEATLPFLTPTVRAMVELQLLTGMRPGDLFHMTGAEVHRGGVVKIGGMARDLDRDDVWAYVRKVHKTARFGHARVIVLGDRERAIIEPRLANRAANVPLFQPVESVAESYRRTHLDMKRTRPGARPYNPKYTRHSYAQAIERAAEKAGVPHWSPYQIRHLVAAETQAKHGLDAVRAKLGQKSVNVAAKYADVDFTKAVDMAKDGAKKSESGS